MQYTRLLLVLVILGMALFFGCTEQSELSPSVTPSAQKNTTAPTSPTANAPSNPAATPQKAETCVERYGPKAGFYSDGKNYYDDLACNGQCKGDETCKKHPTKYIILKNQSGAPVRSCYICEKDPCQEKWQCSDWFRDDKSICTPDGKQIEIKTRTCTDANACGTQKTKPAETETEAKDCQYSFPDFITLIDGQPSDTFIVGQNKKIDLEIKAKEGWKIDFPIEVNPSGVFDPGSTYIFYNDPHLPLKLEDKITAGDAIGVKCTSVEYCTTPTDWPEKYLVSGTATFSGFDFSAFYNDKEYPAPSYEITIGEKNCTENWQCGQWGACTGGKQTRICTDLNFCATSTSKPAVSRTCSECAENWQCDNWGACTGGQQSRTCSDMNNCGTSTSKPAVSQTCQACTENWQCADWGAWGDWSACSESGTASKSRTRSCTDASSCGTTNSKPESTQSDSQSCTYTPTHQKPEYTAHESALGSKISNLDYNGASESKDLSSSGGEWGYRILNIPAHATITVCVSGTTPFSFFYYPQYPYGYDFTDTTPGCTQIYNKNNWADGVLVHLGDPTPANVNTQITVTH